MDARFTYTRSTYTRTSVISRALAEQLADVIPHDAPLEPWPAMDQGRGQFLRDAAIEFRCYVGDDREAPPINRLHWDAKLFALVDGLPDPWFIDVWQVQDERARAKRAADLLAAAEAFEAPPAIKRRLVKAVSERGFEAPERSDLTRLRPARPYTPKGGCAARMKLAEAVRFSYRQESYADHSTYLVPVEGEITDAQACRSNLAAWCESIRTHNGFAGSGSTWSASLVIEPDGAYVEIDCRASISD
jgi:hypothetical protein